LRHHRGQRSLAGLPMAGHGVSHLDVIRDALAPLESDHGGAAYVDAVKEVAAALNAVVIVPTSKSRASTQVTGRVAASLVEWCPRCKADRSRRAVPRGRASGTDRPRPGGTPRNHAVPDSGPSAGEGSSPAPGVAERLPPAKRSDQRDSVPGLDGQRQCRIQADNRRFDLPEALVDAVRQAPKADGVVLVPPNDPYLSQVDRTLLAPDSKRRQQLWRALSGPGRY
jgi:hypothetical protein